MQQEISQFLDCHNDVVQLSKNLFHDMDFNYFGYAQFSKNDKGIFLSSNPKFSSELFKQKCSVVNFNCISSLVDSGKLLKHGNYYFGIIDYKNYDNKKLASSHSIFDVSFVVEKIDNGFLVFSYGSHKKNNVINSLLHRPDALLKHKHQFLDQYQRKINSLQPIIREGRKSQEIIEENDMTYNPDKFKASMNPSHYFCGHNGKQVRITAREKEALQHLARAKTAKEIAQVMNIQPITVITYLKNLQEKLGVTTKRELLRFYYNSDLCVMDAEYFMPERKK